MTELTDRTGSEIAIVGIAGRFPGARTLHEFWSNLKGGIESIQRLSDEALRDEGVSDEMLRDPSYVKAAAILEDLEWWDARFWGFSPRDAAIMDPQHRLFLECAYEALETAGHAPDRFPGAIGVYAGVGMGAYFQSHLLNSRDLLEDVGLFLLRHTGNDKDFLATRVSYELDLRGPSISVQTACSTSLVAMHVAGQALLNGEVDLALAGGVTIELPHRVGYRYRADEILSPDGHCRAFDAQSQGTVFGSGAGVVVLRRLQDALDDGDHIFGVMRGSAINNDGSGKVGYLAPSIDGQAAAIAEALDMAGVSAESIDYVEAHGTGTAVGDPIEVAALTQAFRQTTRASGYCGLGSVKTNIGHLDTAAGVAGVIKVLLALGHEEIPATLHYRAPNPLIDFSTTPFQVLGEARPWPRGGRPRRAGVSSLGVGGTNAHVVLEEAPVVLPQTVAAAERFEVVPLSARTPTALKQMSANLADELRDQPGHRLGDVAWTLQSGRISHAHRRVVIARSTADVAAALEQAEIGLQASAEAPTGAAPVAMCFAGGGAQHAGMARALYDSEPAFRAIVDEGLEFLEPPSREMVRAALLSTPSDTHAATILERPSVGLPALLLTQVAMGRLWMQWGVSPAALIGHSMGEYTAAHFAGVFSLADAVRLVALRGRLFEQVPEGAMLSVAASPEQLAPYLGVGVSIAAVNGATLCVASGPRQSVDELAATLGRMDIECRRVPISVAAHSAMLDPILAEFEAFLRTVRLSAPRIPVVSNLTGTWMRDVDAVDPRYWVRHLRETVRFADGLHTLLQQPDQLLLEVGPGKTLSSLARLHPSRTPSQALFTSLPPVSDETPVEAFVRATLGALWCHGVSVDWAALRGDRSARRVPLPTYPWERQRYWVERPTGTSRSADESVATRASDPAEWFYAPVWRRADATPGTVESAVVWLVANAADETANELARRWEESGCRVVRLRDVGTFARVGDGVFDVCGHDAADWTRVWSLAAAEGILPRHIVHASALSAPDAGLQSAAFLTLVALGDALVKEDRSEALTLTVLTRGALEVIGDDVHHPLAAMALGAVHGLPSEVPSLDARLIDLAEAEERGARTDRVIARLEAEILLPVDEAVVAYRHGRRWVRRHDRVAGKTTAAGAPALRAGGTYLITGGLGGLGLRVAEWMATARANVVLVGRRALPPRASWTSGRTSWDAETAARVEAVRRLESMGATVLARAADVTDPDQLKAVIDEVEATFGAIHGVVHAAGVAADALLGSKSAEDMQQVIGPKVQGTLALESALADRALDFLICFSSVSAMAGLPGQIDYAAANAFLDSWCASQATRTHRPTLSLAWSAWRDVGMVARPRKPSGGPVSHPLLERALRGGENALHATVLDPARQWLIAEHRLADGPSLIPGTGYLEIARAALAPWAARPGKLLELRDVAFLSPLVLHDDAPREMRIAVQLQDATARFVIVGSATPGEDGVGWQEHVLGEAVCVDGALPPPVDLMAVSARCGQAALASRAQERDPHLDFGPRWNNVRRAEIGATEALLELALAEEFADDLPDFALHPALMDMATAGAQVLIPHYDRMRDFFVPLSYSRVTVYAPLQREVRSVIRLRPSTGDEPDLAVFDVTITDPSGRVLVDIEEFLMTRVKDREQLLAPAGSARRRRSTLDVETEVLEESSGADPSWYAGAIRPEEGAVAMAHASALASGHTHLLVSPYPLETLLSRLREEAGPKAPLRPQAVAAPRVPVHLIEQALVEHEAVSHAVVMQRSDRTGSVRLVAYVELSAQGRATVSELRRFLKRGLPSHLVPSTYVMMDAWPRLADGTIQREALSDPFGAVDDFVAPRTKTEQAIASVWSEMLGIERISVYDNFFDVGGHSLLAVRVISRLDKRIGVRLNQAIMVLQTLEQIAAECDRRLTSSPARGSA